MSKTISQSEYIHNYDALTARLELYDELQKGLDDIAAGRTIPAEEVHARLEKNLKDIILNEIYDSLFRKCRTRYR